MFRFLFRHSVGVCERGVLLKCNTAAASVSRAAHVGGLRAFSGSSSVRLCEKKNADPDTPAETPAAVTETAAGDGLADIKVDKQSETPAELKTKEGESPTQQQQQTDVKQVTAKHEEAKSSKEGLLTLLRAMKVDVTNKRKTRGRNAAAAKSNIDVVDTVTMEDSEQSDTLDPELVTAASAAASTLPNPSQAASDLLKQLREHEAVSEEQRKGDTNYLSVITNMKVRKNQLSNRQLTPASQIQFDDDGRGYTISRERRPAYGRRSLFGGKRLKIFSPEKEGQVESAAARPTLWDVEFAYQLSKAANHMPRNGLEEMIQWTKEGKMWQYPINNEAVVEEEASVPFHEHVFLDKHLEEGFPRQGPVRHFMELVVTGLSRNPYLTVQQKTEHISWFRDYFQQKEAVLKEAEA